MGPSVAKTALMAVVTMALTAAVQVHSTWPPPWPHVPATEKPADVPTSW